MSDVHKLLPRETIYIDQIILLYTIKCVHYQNMITCLLSNPTLVILLPEEDIYYQ